MLDIESVSDDMCYFYYFISRITNTYIDTLKHSYQFSITQVWRLDLQQQLQMYIYVYL